MPDAYRLGKDAKIYRNTGTWGAPTWVEITVVREVTLNLEKGEFDGSRRGSAWRQKAGTLKDASVEIEILHKPTDAGWEALRDAWLNGTVIDLLVCDGDRTVTGNEGLRAEMQVMSMTRNEPLEEGLTWNLTIVPGISTNEPEWFEAA